MNIINRFYKPLKTIGLVTGVVLSGAYIASQLVGRLERDELVRVNIPNGYIVEEKGKRLLTCSTISQSCTLQTNGDPKYGNPLDDDGRFHQFSSDDNTIRSIFQRDPKEVELKLIFEGVETQSDGSKTVNYRIGGLVSHFEVSLHDRHHFGTDPDDPYARCYMHVGKKTDIDTSKVEDSIEGQPLAFPTWTSQHISQGFTLKETSYDECDFYNPDNKMIVPDSTPEYLILMGIDKDDVEVSINRLETPRQ